MAKFRPRTFNVLFLASQGIEADCPDWRAMECHWRTLSLPTFVLVTGTSHCRRVFGAPLLIRGRNIADVLCDTSIRVPSRAQETARRVVCCSSPNWLMSIGAAKTRRVCLIVFWACEAIDVLPRARLCPRSSSPVCGRFFSAVSAVPCRIEMCPPPT